MVTRILNLFMETTGCGQGKHDKNDNLYPYDIILVDHNLNGICVEPVTFIPEHSVNFDIFLGIS